ncbi:MAG: DMT family transporter [Rhodospirillales bacterium]|nr:DMT family transporter [Rhodospirillales bacterium]
MASSPRISAATIPMGGVILLAALTLFWGGNWPFMKMALGEIPVWWFRTICLTVGGASLLLIAGLSGQITQLQRYEIKPLLACTVLNVVGWHLFSAYGVSLMPAGRAVIIAFTMPVWASILSSFYLNEPLTVNKFIALGLGMAGLAVLIGPDLWVMKEAPIGALCMLGAAVSWALGTVAFKRTNWTASTSALAGWQLVFASIPITIGAVLLQPMPDWSTISPRTWYSMIYILAFPMVFCQWAYFKSVRAFPASLAAISTLGIPVVGAFSSALILGEHIGIQEITALILVCAALGSVLLLPALQQSKP